ncbi:MAG: TonB family protein [Candidatus Sulfotelmatobacter sp.]
MPYQALLFCPDEKTARTVTQVLRELEFVVVPCAEPFAAVKRLMAEHFDAVVVDGDHEQNAALLFKSAHNSSNNQASLAVALVDGQAGVGNAFRIGANLVLTKPINVEQAKGTLRAARGLLRKSEAARPAAASAGASTAPSFAAPVFSKRAPTPTTSTTPSPRTVTPIPDAAPISKPEAPVPRPIIAYSDSTTFPEGDADSGEEINGPVSQFAADSAISTAVSVTSSGAASAPAPAREPEETVAEEETALSASSFERHPESAADMEISPATSEPVTPTPLKSASVTLGGTDSRQPSGGGSNKALRAIVAIVLLAAAAYAVWTLFRGKSATQVPEPATTSASTTPVLPTDLQQRAGNSATQASSSSPQSTEPDDAASDAVKSSHSTVASTKVHTARKLIAVKNNSSRVLAAKSGADVPDPLGIAVPGNQGSMPNFSATDGSAYRPRLQTVNVSQGVSQGLLYKRVQPTYPTSALRMRVEGKVELQATISSQGDVTDVKVLSGKPLLAQSATDALKQWKYKPYLLNGEPVDIQTQITVNFRLPR